MSEVEKLYELAGVNKKCIDKRYEKCTGVCYDCKYFIYPPFTAEKQLQLIKWLLCNGHCYFTVTIKPSEFTEYLARYINNVWQDLIETDKAEIKDILEGWDDAEFNN